MTVWTKTATSDAIYVKIGFLYPVTNARTQITTDFVTFAEAMRSRLISMKIMTEYAIFLPVRKADSLYST